MVLVVGFVLFFVVIKVIGFVGGEGFYVVLLYNVMVVIFVFVFLLLLVSIVVGIRCYWCEVGG